MDMGESKSVQRNPYQIAFDFSAPHDNSVPVYTLEPVKWSGGYAVGVFEVPGDVFVRTPADVANHLNSTIFRHFDAIDHEQLWVLLLDTKNRVKKHVLVYKGNLNSAVVRVGELFKDALRFNAAAIIITHNHPSGDPVPSPEDVHVTESIIEAGRILDITVMDHLIIGRRPNYVSMKERGLAFK